MSVSAVSTIVASAVLTSLVSLTAGAAEVSSAATSACMSAVNRNYGGKVKSLHVAKSEPLPEKGQTIFYIVADGEHWRCRATNNGAVEDLTAR